MITVPDTGERILLDKESPLMIARHFCAYRFIKDIVCNKKVLDIGCGEGYGSFYLASFSKSLTGIDYDQAIIEYAKEKYRRENLEFRPVNTQALCSLDDKFDIICSFQVIEHIRDTKGLLENIKKLLKDDGKFICSTPNRLDASPKSDTPLNKFHVREYLYQEFQDLLGSCFQKVTMFGLKKAKKLRFYRRLKKMGLFNLLPFYLNPVKRFYSRIDCDNFIFEKDRLEAALDFIAVCEK